MIAHNDVLMMKLGKVEIIGILLYISISCGNTMVIYLSFSTIYNTRIYPEIVGAVRPMATT